ncbi:amidohydrolase family protein [Candidatus Woesearchaeota archaeon]|nr:amidohydrolase family protein [Candidatus Woesearchaeota archaeon]
MRISGKIVNHDEFFVGTIEIDEENGLITKVKRCKSNKAFYKYFDPNIYIFPGFVDIHVHAREDISGKNKHKEDFQSCSRAAINGGVTAIADMPNNPIPPVDDESYLAKKEIAERNSLVPVLLYAGIGPDTMPLSFDVPYKLYFAPSTESLNFDNYRVMERRLKLYTGKQVSFHCEDPEVMRASSHMVQHEDKRPEVCEVIAIERAIDYIRKFKLDGVICHVSTKRGLESIVKAKLGVINLSCEVAPHYLYFDVWNKSDCKYPKWIKMNPPARSVSDRQFILKSFNLFDFLASDHAPHSKVDKECDEPSGLPGLDTYSNLVAWLHVEKGINVKTLSRVCSYNPGRFVSRFMNERFGRVEEGYAANLTVLNFGETTRITNSYLRTKCAWSPWEDMELPGKVVNVFVKGKKMK